MEIESWNDRREESCYERLRNGKTFKLPPSRMVTPPVWGYEPAIAITVGLKILGEALGVAQQVGMLIDTTQIEGDTIGQPDAGALSGGSCTLGGGFRGGAGRTSGALYLPLIV